MELNKIVHSLAKVMGLQKSQKKMAAKLILVTVKMRSAAFQKISTYRVFSHRFLELVNWVLGGDKLLCGYEV